MDFSFNFEHICTFQFLEYYISKSLARTLKNLVIFYKRARKKSVLIFFGSDSDSKYFSTHKHVLCLSTSKLRKSSSILSPCGTRISHSQSKLFAYVSGCWGDENWPVLDVNKPPQPGIPTITQKKVT